MHSLINTTLVHFLHSELGFFHDGVLLANNSVIPSIHEDGLLCLSTNSGCCEDEATTADWFSPGAPLQCHLWERQPTVNRLQADPL